MRRCAMRGGRHVVIGEKTDTRTNIYQVRSSASRCVCHRGAICCPGLDVAVGGHVASRKRYAAQHWTQDQSTMKFS